ncbi:MAG: hypothetical protein M1831_007056 [Alyxoria varia]|nr:MAG: hypothetical protein M1831_007056 [Alyxoria varia]
MARSGTSTSEEEARVLGITHHIPFPWTEMTEQKDIKCCFMTKWPPEPSPDTSDSEEAHQKLRVSTFNPPFDNVLYAAGFLTTLLRDSLGENDSETAFAVLGGIAVKAHGVDRPFTNDVDIAYEGPIRTLWNVLLRDSRCAMPKTRFVGQAFTMFAKIGPSEGDPLAQNSLIKIQFLVNGFGSKGFANEVVMLRIGGGEIKVDIQCLNRTFLVRSKLQAYCMSFRPKDWHDVNALLLGVEDPVVSLNLKKIDKAMWADFLESPPQDAACTTELIKTLASLKHEE